MKYRDGREVLLGDLVDLGGDMQGIVVAVMDTRMFSANYPEAEWEYLGVGALVESVEAGLVYYDSPEHDFELIRRGNDQGSHVGVALP